MNLATVLLFITGGVLIYSGIKDRNPRDVVADALKGRATPGAKGSATKTKGGVSSEPYKPPKDGPSGQANV